MANSVYKLVPTGVMAATVTWCVWPYLFARESAADKPSDKLPTISAALLKPTISAAPQRDPFQPATVAVNGAAALLIKSWGALGFLCDLLPDRHPAAPAQADARRPAAAAGSGAASSRNETRPLDGLALKATSIYADRRLAIINGQIYEQGQRLDLPESSAEPWVVARILPYKVLLEGPGQVRELTYADPPAPPDDSPATAAAAEAPRSPAAGETPGIGDGAMAAGSTLPPPERGRTP